MLFTVKALTEMCTQLPGTKYSFRFPAFANVTNVEVECAEVADHVSMGFGVRSNIRCDVNCGFLIRRAVYHEVTKGSTFARPLGVVCAGWVFEGCRREKLCVCVWDL